MSKIFSVSGGIVEAEQAYQSKWHASINSMPLPKTGTIWLGDASTPEPNFRAIEAFMAMVGLASTGPLVALRTFMCAGSTFVENGHLWKLNAIKNAFWMEFFKETGIMDRIPADFAPLGDGIYKAVGLRKQTLFNMWNTVSPYLKVLKMPINLALQVQVFEELFKGIAATDIEKCVPLDGIILKIPCPSCSYQHKKPIYHAVRRTYNGINVTKDERSLSSSGCKGAKAINANWKSLTVYSAGIGLGARLSGKSVFYLTSLIQPNMVIRDYSNPRGTVTTTINSWGRNIWVSARTYLPDEITGFKLEKLIAINPKKWAEKIKNHPLFGDGLAHHVGID